jgi:hypothetical protein
MLTNWAISHLWVHERGPGALLIPIITVRKGAVQSTAS